MHDGSNLGEKGVDREIWWRVTTLQPSGVRADAVEIDRWTRTVRQECVWVVGAGRVGVD